jgi:hypothetical protein
MILKTHKIGVLFEKALYLSKSGKYIPKKSPFKLHAKFRSIYSFAVYFGSSIYIGAVPEVVERYNISIEVSSLALALYVFGC